MTGHPWPGLLRYRIERPGRAVWAAVMEPRPPSAEDHPARYRAILDCVAELERAGMRREAVRVRAQAIAIYSRGWDQASLKRLTELLERARRELARRKRSLVLDAT
jgi:hypothetical protein